MSKSDRKSLDELIQALKQQKFAKNVSYNLTFFHEGRYIIWNDDDKCFYVCNFNEERQISFEHKISLTCPPVFAITSVCANPFASHVSLHGPNGVCVVDLPRHWSRTTTTTATTPPKSSDSGRKPKSTARSYLLAERMFVCSHGSVEVLCLRWHPLSPKHLYLLTSDDVLRLFNIDEPLESIGKVNLNIDGADFEAVSSFAASFCENAVSFDFGPALSRYQTNGGGDNPELSRILPIFILKGNGDVLLIYSSLDEINIGKQIFGPLRMSPAAEDNYGSDALSILCLDCVPPILVIGTGQGVIYQCIAIENDPLETGKSKEKLRTANGLTINMPELVLYVFERIELAYSVTTSGTYEDATYDESDSMLTFLKDINNPKRYFCLHKAGLHVIQVSFLAQLASLNAGDKGGVELFEEKSIIEYLMCTKPSSKYVDGSEEVNDNRIIGLTLTIEYGFTSFTILMNTCDIVSKRLTNVVNTGDQERELAGMLTQGASLVMSKASPAAAAAAPRKRPTFLEQLEKLLAKNVNIPLMMMVSSKAKTAPVGMAELEMLLNSIDIMRKEYHTKLTLAAKAINQRKAAQKTECQHQLDQLNEMNATKDKLLKQYEQLLIKFHATKDSHQDLLERFERVMLDVQRQGPALTLAERAIKQEIDMVQDKVELYNSKVEQLMQKAAYQQKSIHSMSPHKHSISLASSSSEKLKKLQAKLASQTSEINELVSLLKLAKVGSV